MPPKRARARKSKKGRLSGAMRESLNADRSELSVQNALKAAESGASVDTMFARVTGHLGMGHVRANFPTKSGAIVEIKAQIPNVLGRKGTTPINSQTVVAIYVGPGFDANKVEKDTHFKITAVLRDSQAAQLVEAGVVPAWMTLKDASATSEGVEEGYVFDYAGAHEEDSDEEEDADEAEEADEAVVVRNTVTTVPEDAAVETTEATVAAETVAAETVTAETTAKKGKKDKAKDHRRGLDALAHLDESGDVDFWG